MLLSNVEVTLLLLAFWEGSKESVVVIVVEEVVFLLFTSFSTFKVSGVFLFPCFCISSAPTSSPKTLSLSGNSSWYRRISHRTEVNFLSSVIPTPLFKIFENILETSSLRLSTLRPLGINLPTSAPSALRIREKASGMISLMGMAAGPKIPRLRHSKRITLPQGILPSRTFEEKEKNVLRMLASKSSSLKDGSSMETMLAKSLFMASLTTSINSDLNSKFSLEATTLFFAEDDTLLLVLRCAANR